MTAKLVMAITDLLSSGFHGLCAPLEKGKKKMRDFVISFFSPDANGVLIFYKLFISVWRQYDWGGRGDTQNPESHDN